MGVQVPPGAPPSFFSVTSLPAGARTEQCRTWSASLVWSLWSTWLVWSIRSVRLLDPEKPNKLKKRDRPTNGLLTLADFSRSLLGCKLPPCQWRHYCSQPFDLLPCFRTFQPRYGRLPTEPATLRINMGETHSFRECTAQASTDSQDECERFHSSSGRSAVAKQAIMDEHRRRFQTLQQEGRWEEALQQTHVTLSCATDLLNESLRVFDEALETHSHAPTKAPLSLPQPRSDWVVPLPSPPSYDGSIALSPISDGDDSCYDRSAAGLGHTTRSLDSFIRSC